MHHAMHRLFRSRGEIRTARHLSLHAQTETENAEQTHCIENHFSHIAVYFNDSTTGLRTRPLLKRRSKGILYRYGEKTSFLTFPPCSAAMTTRRNDRQATLSVATPPLPRNPKNRNALSISRNAVSNFSSAV